MQSIQPRHLIALALFGAFCTGLGAGCTALLFAVFEEDPYATPVDGTYGPGPWSGGQAVPQAVDAEAWIQAMQAAQLSGAALQGSGFQSSGPWQNRVGIGNAYVDGSAGYVHLPSATGGAGTTVGY